MDVSRASGNWWAGIRWACAVRKDWEPMQAGTLLFVGVFGESASANQCGALAARDTG